MGGTASEPSVTPRKAWPARKNGPWQRPRRQKLSENKKGTRPKKTTNCGTAPREASFTLICGKLLLCSTPKDIPPDTRCVKSLRTRGFIYRLLCSVRFFTLEDEDLRADTGPADILPSTCHIGKHAKRATEHAETGHPQIGICQLESTIWQNGTCPDVKVWYHGLCARREQQSFFPC